MQNNLQYKTPSSQLLTSGFFFLHLIYQPILQFVRYLHTLVRYSLASVRHPHQLVRYPLDVVRGILQATIYPHTVSRYLHKLVRYPLGVVRYPLQATRYPHKGIIAPILVLLGYDNWSRMSNFTFEGGKLSLKTMQIA